MQSILHIPSLDAAPGLREIQPLHAVGTAALAVVNDPGPDLLAVATVIGRVANVAGEPAPLIAPEHQATYDLLYPRTPVTWTDEEGILHTDTPPALFGCLGLPPPEASLSAVKAAKWQAISRASEEAIDWIRIQYPAYERETWKDQENSAREWLAWNAAPVDSRGAEPATPTLSPIATARGLTLAVLAARVVEKADTYRASVSAVIGKRQALEDQITAATTNAQVEVIAW